MKRTKTKILSVFLSLCMIISCMAGMSVTASADDVWQTVALSDIENGDTVIVTMTKSDLTYGLYNGNGTSQAPSAVELSVSDGILTGSDTALAGYTWIVGRNGNTLSFRTGNEMLYCNNDNNGVRVGESENYAFEIKDDYLYNTATARYLGIYNNQNWRCYTSTNYNIKNQVLKFLKKESSAPQSSTLTNTTTTWSGEYTVSSNVTIDSFVTVSADTKLTIAEGVTVTVNGSINAEGKTITVEGKGTLVVTGADGIGGTNGYSGEEAGDGEDGSNGGDGIIGNVIVNGATVTVTGGNGGWGGHGGEGLFIAGDGGNAGHGGSGISGNLTVNSGSATVTGGSGGNGGDGGSGIDCDDGIGGNGDNGGSGVLGNVTVTGGTATITGGDGGTGGYDGNGGDDGYAVSGTITGSAQESDNNSTWYAVSGTISSLRYVKVAAAAALPAWTNGNVTATLDGTKLTVAKTDNAENGNMGTSWTKVGSAAAWSSIRGTITEVEIKDGVTSIGNGAFNYFLSLTSVTIPNSVTSIGARAFSDCSKLKSVIIPNNVTSIGMGAFAGCSELTSVTFERPANTGNLSVSEDAFVNPGEGYYVPSTAAIAYSGTGSYALFDGDTEITTTNTAGDLNGKSLTWKAASSTPAWTNGNVTATLDGTKLTVAKTDNAENGDMGTSWVQKSPNTTTWASVKGTITEVEIQDGVTSIGDTAFLYCEALTSVTIPSSVTSIGISSFFGCSALTSVTIPSSVTSIGNAAFYYCTALTSVTIPNSVTSIGLNTFKGCSNLTSVTFIPGTAGATLSIGESAFNSTKSGATVAYGTGDTVLYDNDTPITTETLLTAIQDKTLTWKAAAAAHTHSFTYSADGATITAACTTGCDITEGLTMTISALTALTYDGTAKEASLSTGYNITAFPGTYTIEYYNGTTKLGSAPVNAGTYTAKVTAGTGDGAATASVEFTITPKTVSSPTITLSPESFTYDGTAKQPTVTVKDGTTTIPASEYNIDYSNNTNAGTATVTVSVKTGGNYAVSGEKTFTISPKEVNNPTIELSQATYTYDGTAKQPTVTVKFGPIVIPAEEYTVNYYHNVNAGTAAVGISDKTGGNYIVNGEKTFTISPASQSAPAVSSTNETIAGKADGTITGVTTAMEYKLSTATEYTPITGTSVTGLAAGTYNVRYAEKANYNASPATNVVINTGSKITVQFDANGGTPAPASQQFNYNQTVSKPATDPTKTGYTFKFWSADGTAEYNFNTPLTANITLTAVYQVNSYTITFDTDGGSTIDAVTQDYGTAVTAPAAPTKTGYSFDGWDKDIPATMPAEDITIKAQWSVNQYTIRFDTNGGSNIAPITQDYGTDIIAPADPIPVSDEVVFAGWVPVIPATMPANDLTVKAVWKDAHPNYVPANTTPTVPTVVPTTPAVTPSAPAATTSVKMWAVQNADKSSITVSWDKVSGATKYTLYLKKNGKLEKVVETKKTKVLIKNVANNTNLEYVLKYTINGIESAENSAYKASIKVNYKPAVKLTASKGSVMIKWSKVPEATKYRVYKYANGSLKLITDTTKNAVRITGTKAGKKYSYAVKALVDGKWTKIYSSDIATVTAK